MNELTVFNNEEFGEIRTITIDGEPWFVGKDVADVLGYSNSSKAILTHVDSEDKTFLMMDIADSQNGNVPIGQTKTAIINESGLYSLIISSKLPNAKAFKRWVTADILPAIRKTGGYMTDELLAKC
jgi:prophage antirepressor-like protein